MKILLTTILCLLLCLPAFADQQTTVLQEQVTIGKASATLHYIDGYMQQWQRYIVTGKHNKANYKKVPYSMLTACGYRPLVSAYYSGGKK